MSSPEVAMTIAVFADTLAVLLAVLFGAAGALHLIAPRFLRNGYRRRRFASGAIRCVRPS